MRISRVSPWLVEPNFDLGLPWIKQRNGLTKRAFCSFLWRETKRLVEVGCCDPGFFGPRSWLQKNTWDRIQYSTMVGWVDTVTSKPQCGSTQLNLSPFQLTRLRSWHFGCRLLYPLLPWPTVWQMLVTWIPWMFGNGLLSLAASWAAWGLKN